MRTSSVRDSDKSKKEECRWRKTFAAPFCWYVCWRLPVVPKYLKTAADHQERAVLKTVAESEFIRKAFSNTQRRNLVKKILLLTAFIYVLNLGLPVVNLIVSISQAQESPEPEPTPAPKPKPESE